MYRAREGWSFDRLGGGRVAIVKRDDTKEAAPIVVEIVMTRDEWCAIVSSVSRTGETIEAFDDAKFIHMGDPILIPTTIVDKLP